MTAPSPWLAHRRRARDLRERHGFAAEMLTLYLALLDAWEDGWALARAERPQPAKLAGWAAERVLPRVVDATASAGPEALAGAAGRGVPEDVLGTWLAGGELEPVERYLARASLWAPLVALGADAAEACADDPSPRDARHCPRCGGLPQLSVRSGTEERLVAGRRRLACARCGHTWSYSASSCPSCGESAGARRTTYAERRAGPVVGRDGDGEEPTVFPHLRVDACASCQRYVVDVDLGRDAGAVPEVDEMVALPLDLYAVDHGLSKITPNLMGF
jgi:FdhE protein